VRIHFDHNILHTLLGCCKNTCNDGRLVQYRQLGPRGFFGDYNVDASSTGGDFASLNAWVGNRLDTNYLVTGTNAGYSQIALGLTPQYGNDHVLLTARYTITPYVTSSAPGAVTTISPPNLASWQVQVKNPIADITVGKKVFRKGFDLQFSRIRTDEYLLLERTCCVPDILGYLVASGVLPRRVMSWFNPDRWPRYKTAATTTNNGATSAQDGVTTDDPEDLLFGKGKSIVKQIDDQLQSDPYFSNGLLKETPEEKARKDKWPTDADAFAWGHTGPGCLRIGFGFFPWELPIQPNTVPSVPPNFSLWNPYDLGANPAQNFLGLVHGSVCFKR